MVPPFTREKLMFLTLKMKDGGNVKLGGN